MPFCCRPSKFCLGCRQRRIKCDMAVPACSQCKRAGKECVGYRDELPLLFRDENARTIRRATAAKARSRAQRKDAGSDSASSPGLKLMRSSHGPITATSLPSTLPSLDMDELGLHFFVYHFSTYAWAGRCQPQNITSPFMRRFGEDATLRSAVASVGLAALSNIRKDEGILRGARQRYGQAIRVIQSTLKSQTADQLDGTMKMILMVALFEIVDANPTSKLSWIVHLQGAAALRNRSPRDFFTKNHRVQIMFTFTWIFKYFQTGGRFPLELEGWAAPDIPVEANDDFPAVSLIEILLKFIRLHASLAKGSDQSMSSALTEALACEMQLEGWSTSLPAKFGYMEKVSKDTSQYFYGRFHLYEDVWASRILIHYLTGRLFVNELILHLASQCDSSIEQILQTAHARRMIIQLAVDICVAAASQPLFPDYMSLNRNGAIPPLSGVFMFMYPLAVAATATGVSDDLREWVMRTLDHIGQTMGIRQALLMKAELAQSFPRVHSSLYIESPSKTVGILTQKGADPHRT
ncbi:Zn(II)2Cys6 transcription factor [Aspergillus fischeri NRRL 181]|uniref:C6 zinc finger domain protein n=1 Tax=Neosartorya fischeri (strain ATCC 1020 / DSM 3700 / CBS 544.65 / FGSC A1164 / JCM 1740 / NRRL 181 / WB 181) TaxID=331117 RepID=A1DJM2_NEOFI|nr:C6 zinc finger domain protein [Aspergillus fischeri NRRL 181]EAW16911.1 C6 zinc finger domain protein [Aspergillus fischeri NRRL 181]